MIALGRARQAKGRQYYDGDVNLPAFLTAKNLKPFIPQDLSVTSSQIEFRTLGGISVFSYSAVLIPQVFGGFLDSKAATGIALKHEHIVVWTFILIRVYATICILDMVDYSSG